MSMKLKTSRKPFTNKTTQKKLYTAYVELLKDDSCDMFVRGLLTLIESSFNSKTKNS